MNKFATRLYEDPVFFVYGLFASMGWDQYNAISDLEEDMILFATGMVPELQAKPKSWRNIIGYRGQGKTRVVSIGCSLWRAFRDPDRRIVFVSLSAEHANKIVLTVKNCIYHSPLLQHLAPREDKGNRNRFDLFDFGPSSMNPQPSVQGIGIDGQLAGIRAHSVFADDVEGESNASSFASRDEIERRCDNFPTWLYKDRAANQKGDNLAIDPSEIVMPGTYKHDDDSLYHRLGRRNGIATRSYPLVYPKPGETVNGLAPSLANNLRSGKAHPGQPTSTRWSVEEVVAKLDSVSSATADREYRLIVGGKSSSNYQLQLDDLIVADWTFLREKAPASVAWGTTDHNGKDTAIDDIAVIAPNQQRLRRPIFRDSVWLPYRSTRGYVDPSGNGGDRTGFSIVSELAGMFYVKLCIGLNGGGDDCDTIAALCKEHGVTELFFESNADTTATWEQFMRQALNKIYDAESGWNCTLTRKHVSTQKELRILHTLRPVMKHHKLVVSREVIAPCEKVPEHELQYQLTRITEQRKCLREDGKIDSLAGCLATWTETSSTLIPNSGTARTRAIENRIEDLLSSSDSITGSRNKHWMLGRFD